ncbi:hypothetical protein GQ53DRAFT_743004 [Thozetella sp. PMI_491]|nr:hypothetical protein GQ53DRAFT_743004 [Thozetella sp. PMI_491]
MSRGSSPRYNEIGRSIATEGGAFDSSIHNGEIAQGIPTRMSRILRTSVLSSIFSQKSREDELSDPKTFPHHQRETTYSTNTFLSTPRSTMIRDWDDSFPTTALSHPKIPKVPPVPHETDDEAANGSVTHSSPVGALPMPEVPRRASGPTEKAPISTSQENDRNYSPNPPGASRPKSESDQPPVTPPESHSHPDRPKSMPFNGPMQIEEGLQHQEAERS